MMKSMVFATGALAFAVAANGAFSAANVPNSVSSVCATMNLTPYSKPEALSVRSAKGTTHFKVEVADSSREREQGLMCRTGLKDDYGMLFEFQNVAERAF